MQTNDVTSRRSNDEQEGEESPTTQAHAAFKDVEDPLARFFANNKKGILITVGGALALYYAVTTFQESRAARLGEAADLFRIVQTQYEEVSRSLVGTGAATKRSEEEQKRVDEEVARLRNSIQALRDREAPYANVAVMYEGMLEHLLGEGQKANALLGGVATLSTGEDPKLLEEVTSLSRARILIDDASTRADGRAALQSLAQSAEWVASSAALALIQSASSPEEKGEALAVAEALILRQPDQAELLRGSMNR